jgi:BCD family chlorophyll transporter-like MFS transporter
MMAGTIASALAIAVLAGVSLLRLAALLPVVVFAVGVANGTFAVAALAMMMELGAAGSRGSEGLRLGLWGAAQAIAFAIGGLASGAAVDLCRRLWPDAGVAYAAVFALGALLFLFAARYARPHLARVARDALGYAS